LEITSLVSLQNITNISPICRIAEVIVAMDFEALPIELGLIENQEFWFPEEFSDLFGND
jgi:hypothetical protein